MAEFIYPWAANPVKALRAEEDARKTGVEVTEDAVRTRYEQIGGLLVHGYESVLPKAVTVTETTEVKDTEPKKASKSSKKASK